MKKYSVNYQYSQSLLRQYPEDYRDSLMKRALGEIVKQIYENNDWESEESSKSFSDPNIIEKIGVVYIVSPKEKREIVEILQNIRKALTRDSSREELQTMFIDLVSILS